MHPALPTPAQLRSITEGFGSSGFIDPGRWAEELLAHTAPEMTWRGADLLAYMIRRFGWPNTGSDDHKDLCAWTLTTDLPGVYLYVKPYLGDSAWDSELHWGIRFNQSASLRFSERFRRGGDSVYREYKKHTLAWWRRWWRLVGQRRFAILGATQDENLKPVVTFFTDDSTETPHVWGLYRREGIVEDFVQSGTVERKRQRRLTRYQASWLESSLDFLLPEAVVKRLALLDPDETMRHDPRPNWVGDGYNARDRALSRQWREEGDGNVLRTVIYSALYDLLWRPVFVRDLAIAGAGLIDNYPDGDENQRWLEPAPSFEGAGHTPEYWYTRRQRRSVRRQV